MTFLSGLEWRFAVRDFDPTRRVSDEDLQQILHAIRLTPTSYGLQPTHVLTVEDKAVRARLREKGFEQAQFTEASHLLVFCSRTDIKARIDAYEELATGCDESAKAAMASYMAMMRGAFEGKDDAYVKAWADRQTYLALGFAMAACAELRLDSTPMEGFSPLAFDDILQLPSHFKSVACLAVGYRVADPKRPKVRFSSDDLFETR